MCLLLLGITVTMWCTAQKVSYFLHSESVWFRSENIHNKTQGQYCYWPLLIQNWEHNPLLNRVWVQHELSCRYIHSSGNDSILSICILLHFITCSTFLLHNRCMCNRCQVGRKTRSAHPLFKEKADLFSCQTHQINTMFLKKSFMKKE